MFPTDDKAIKNNFQTRLEARGFEARYPPKLTRTECAHTYTHAHSFAQLTQAENPTAREIYNLPYPT